MPESEKEENLRERARQVLLKNYRRTNGRYITPAWPHYKNQWVWDSAFHAIACAELDMPDLAQNEIRQLLEWQDARGWIPHRIYHDNFNLFDLERPLYRTGGWRPKCSRLVGQPVLAQAVEAIGDTQFTHEVIESLVSFYRYFLDYRDAENILSIISPRESGRDGAPVFDFFRPVTSGRWRFLNRLIDPLWVLWLDWRLMRAGWDEQIIFQNNIFHVKDVAEHCILIDGLYALQRLLQTVGKEGLFPDIAEATYRCEQALELAWDSRDRTFYPLRVTASEGQGEIVYTAEPIRELSLGALFPLLVQNITAQQRESTIGHLRNPDSFWTEYPVPSVPVSHLRFDPASSFPIWRGPTWLNSNWFILRGLLRHGYREEAAYIARKSWEMVEREGFYEFYNPLSGRGRRVSDFGWTTLVTTFPSLLQKPEP